MSGLRILEVVGICGGGLGRHVKRLCDDLVADGDRITVAYAPHTVDRAFKEFVDRATPVIRFVPLRIRREIAPVSDLRAFLELRRLIKQEGPFDVIHGHSAKGGVLARAAARWHGGSALYTPHSLIMTSPEVTPSKALLYTVIERILGRWATSAIIAVSEGERRFILDSKLVPAERVALIENGIDAEDFRCGRRPARAIDAASAPLTFGAAMRFTAAKAPGLLTEAFSQMCRELPHPPVRLLLAGDGELFEEVEAQIANAGLEERVTLLGWQADVRELLCQVDIYVLPSLNEGFSYALLEAMAAELPIVSTNVFGAAETVAMVTGNVAVSAGDCAALAQGMKQLATLEEPQRLRQSLRRIGKRNHEYVALNFTRQRSTHRTRDLYRAQSGRPGHE